MKRVLFILAMVQIIPCAIARIREASDFQIVPFGEGGQIKMLYDARQRPQAVYLENKLHLVFNGGGKPGDKPKAKTTSMAVTYDPLTRAFSEIVTIGTASSDHHDGPVIWADMEERLHVFYGWHHDLGTHLISKKPRSVGASLDDWSIAPPPAPKMSYQWMSRVYDNKQLVFYRTDGHYSSWTYRITSDNGKTWEGPESDVTDLDIRGGMDTDWSIYCAKAVSKDGNYLHVGFIAYDDYKRPRSPEELATGKLDKRRQQNPLYDFRRVSYKYNLYYIKVNLRTHEVMNHEGEILQTPIDLPTANDKCKIWDTQWRGGGIVPSMLVEENDQVSFLHNISDFQHEQSCDYYYVRFVNGAWKQTRITDSNHEWNSGYLAKSVDGTLHAYVITGEGYFDSDGYMDKHGGGNIEEWTSIDQGNTWKKARDLTPDKANYSGWRYNNIQPVKRPDGTLVDGMLLFYGWKDKDAPEAKAFLLIDDK
ncbi:BNR-4 repeat-containing protein [Planctomycetota bacterium]